MAYHRYHGINTHIVRIFNTYGERMRLDDGRVVPNFMGQALRGEPLTVYGDGSQTRSFCYVADLVEGIVRLLFTDFHEPVNLGNPNEVTILEFAKEILELSGSQERDRLQAAAAGRSRSCASPTSRGPERCSAGSRRSTATRGCGGRWSILEAICEKPASLCGIFRAGTVKNNPSPTRHSRQVLRFAGWLGCG